MARKPPKKRARRAANHSKGLPTDFDGSSRADGDDSLDPVPQFHDSLKLDLRKEADVVPNDGNPSDESDNEALSEWEEDDEDLGKAMREMGDEQDGLYRTAQSMNIWVQNQRRKIPGGRPDSYMKGPDVMNKSTRTQRRYKQSWKGQTILSFGRSGPEASSTYRKSNSNNHAAVSKGPQCSTKSNESDSKLSQFREHSHTGSFHDSLQSSIRDHFLPVTLSPALSIQSISPAPSVVTVPSTRAPSETSSVTSSTDSESESLSDGENGSDAGDGSEPGDSEGEELGEDDAELWEDELDDAIGDRPKAELTDWMTVREIAKNQLRKNSKTLRLTKINQLQIIRNFATLRLKGISRMQASAEIARQWHEGNGIWFARRVRALVRHFQTFEQLPREKRGGSSNAHSWLHNESVQAHTRSWLTAQTSGKVTPRRLAAALNSSIFPELGIILRRPLSVRTAQRWLVKLGWRYTRVKKGVYMDGHEREDVVKYRNEIFLPKMAEYETRMVHYDSMGNEQAPVLKPGEKRIIACFHDECCFHANDETNNAWLREGEQPLRKKGRGRLIHVSDWIAEPDGRLIIRDDSGRIIRDARKIIFPGSNGDAWWDCEQLIVQAREAIRIFNNAYPDCQALFVFDNSSAHASLPPDALKAFEMNKSDGGKQRRQRDTVIPESNPIIAKRGCAQKMMTGSGQPKGLKAVLEERGFNVSKMRAKCSPVCPIENTDCCMARLLSQQDDFKNQVSMLETLVSEAGHLCLFLPKFHCELNPIEMVSDHNQIGVRVERIWQYWGWCKYRYREVSKTGFAHAKQVAVELLDACPPEVIRRFINRSWRFMSAYRKGLSGKAAEWAVRKQKGHRAVSNSAMMSLEAVLN